MPGQNCCQQERIWTQLKHPLDKLSSHIYIKFKVSFPSTCTRTLFWTAVCSWRNCHHWNLKDINSMRHMSQISKCSAIFPVLQKLTHIYRHTFTTWTSRLRCLGVWRTPTRTSRQKGKWVWGIKNKANIQLFLTTSLKIQVPFSRGSVTGRNLFPTPTPAPEMRICCLVGSFPSFKTLVRCSCKLKICLRSSLLLRGCSEGVQCASAGFCVQAGIKRRHYKNAFQYTRQPRNKFLLTTLHSSRISSFPRLESGRYDPLYGFPPTVTP